MPAGHKTPTEGFSMKLHAACSVLNGGASQHGDMQTAIRLFFSRLHMSLHALPNPLGHACRFALNSAITRS